MAPVCPHSRRTLKKGSDITPPNRSDDCPVCLEPYFSTRSAGQKALPVEMHCGHVCCEPCLLAHFQSSIKCIYPYCTATTQNSHLQDTCELCVAWNRNHGPPGATKIAAMVDPKWMLTSLQDLAKDLAKSYRMCRLPRRTTRISSTSSKVNLQQFEGHAFEAEDLAEIFDPLLNVVDRSAWLNSSFGDAMIQPAPAALATIPVNNLNIALYPNGEEPWVTTVLRVWAHDWVKEEGVEMALDHVGYLTERQVRAGITELDMLAYPTKRILNHRVAEDGSVEYFVRWLGYNLPKFDSWVSSEYIDPGVHKGYDAEHGL